MKNAQITVSSKQIDDQFSQLQKLEAIGRLAGGVAHDFNNLLTVIIGYCEVLLSEQLSDRESRDLIVQIRHAGDRASKLTRQLLAFSRKQRIQPVVLNLNSIVANMVIMLRRLIGENVELITTLEPDLPLIKADAGQLEQVIVNLAVNARDVMPKGGTLTIETGAVEVGLEAAAGDADIPPGAYIKLVVRDTGHGMDQATMSHLFEPFFTTKETGKGTGLGLATVYGIVKQSGGHIKVASKCGVGTRFKIYFPQAEGAVEEKGPEPTPLQKVACKETILLVEDDPALRTLGSRILRSNGYHVLEANHGREALSISARHAGSIELMVTDVIMPFLSGPKLASMLAHHRPKMKILYMSGYTDSFIAQQGEQAVGTALLEKPFTPESIAAAVRNVLDH